MALTILKEELVGMTSGFHYVHPDKVGQLFINEVSVLEDFRNMTIARALVSFLIRHGKSWVAVKH